MFTSSQRAHKNESNMKRARKGPTMRSCYNTVTIWYSHVLRRDQAFEKILGHKSKIILGDVPVG